MKTYVKRKEQQQKYYERNKKRISEYNRKYYLKKIKKVKIPILGATNDPRTAEKIKAFQAHNPLNHA